MDNAAIDHKLELAIGVVWARMRDLAPAVAVATFLVSVVVKVDEISPLAILTPLLVMWVAAALDAVVAIANDLGTDDE